MFTKMFVLHALPQVLWSGVRHYPLDIGTEISTLNQLLSAGLAAPVVCAALHTIRTICVGVGYVPRTANQNAICRTLGLRNITSLALSSGGGTVDDDLIRMEAVLTLAILQLGQIIAKMLLRCTDVNEYCNFIDIMILTNGKHIEYINFSGYFRQVSLSANSNK